MPTGRDDSKATAAKILDRRGLAASIDSASAALKQVCHQRGPDTCAKVDSLAAVVRFRSLLVPHLLIPNGCATRWAASLGVDVDRMHIAISQECLTAIAESLEDFGHASSIGAANQELDMQAAYNEIAEVLRLVENSLVLPQALKDQSKSLRKIARSRSRLSSPSYFLNELLTGDSDTVDTVVSDMCDDIRAYELSLDIIAELLRDAVQDFHQAYPLVEHLRNIHSRVWTEKKWRGFNASAGFKEWLLGTPWPRARLWAYFILEGRSISSAIRQPGPSSAATIAFICCPENLMLQERLAQRIARGDIGALHDHAALLSLFRRPDAVDEIL